MQWGWNPDSFTAMATGVAMLAAVFAGFSAARAFRQTLTQTEHVRQEAEAAQLQAAAAIREAKRARKRERRAQAESVLVWMEAVPSGDQSGENSCAWTLSGFAFNTSSAPVFDLYVGLDLGTKEDPDIWYLCSHHLLPARGGQAEPRTLRLNALTYGDWESWVRKHPKNPNPRVEIHFRDSSGRRWMRDQSGRLQPVSEDAPAVPEWVTRRKRSLAAAPAATSG